jgi:hypothetical protein
MIHGTGNKLRKRVEQPFVRAVAELRSACQDVELTELGRVLSEMAKSTESAKAVCDNDSVRHSRAYLLELLVVKSNQILRGRAVLVDPNYVNRAVLEFLTIDVPD